jgi:hypothetical protein
LANSIYQFGLPNQIGKVIAVWRAVDQDIREWTTPDSEDPTHLLAWLQRYIDDAEPEDCRPELNDYRLWAHGIACDLMWTALKEASVACSNSAHASHHWSTYEEQAYWRCVSICSASWLEPEPKRYKGL